VSTVIFNANPLLRYDGYYILSDFVEIPNLRQKSTTILTRLMSKWCLGMEQQEDPFLPQRNHLFFAAYTVAAVIYRWIVLFSILWFMYHVLEPYGLKVVSQMLAAMSLIGVVVIPLYKLGKYFWVPGRLDQVKGKNVRWTLAVVSLVVGFFLFVPLPRNIVCSLEVKAQDAASVYVAVPGFLEEVLVRPGDQVAKDQPLARLRNLDLELAVGELAGKRDLYQTRLDTLRRQVSERVNYGEEIRQVAELLASIKSQLAQRQQDVDRLTLRAPRAGTVLPPAEVPKRTDNGGQLPAWSGSPFDGKNIGAKLDESTLFCQVGDPDRMEAVLVVDQDEVDTIWSSSEEGGAGSEVSIQLDMFPGRRFYGHVAEISSHDLKVSPRRLSQKAGGDLVTKTDESGVERPMSTSYQALVPLTDAQQELILGLKGRARVEAAPLTLYQRLARLIVQTFHFRL
jgi:putative peptide zinc metalloprotease protein